ncbi:hypothetical protein JRQ81_003613 [Phrynocephalus forsythii]|uniref:Uncharacterized protein n=1 Tax=Phrynocephalus forsythii TaxID=171643 RepID=A0A9Q0XKU8_9SAUR|nr:hypothetical protein JRQ81_003613 [Phrynocephalus forsythii]
MAGAGGASSSSSSSPPAPPLPPSPLARGAAEEEEEEEGEGEGEGEGEEAEEGEEEEEEEEEEEDPPPRALVPRSSPVPRPQQHPSAPGGSSSSSDDDDQQEEEEEEEEEEAHCQHPCLARPSSQHPPGLPGPLSQHALQDGQGLLSQQAQGQQQGQQPGLPSQHPPAVAPTAEEPPLQAASRHVLFADALGLPLASWRRYQPWPPPSPESPPEVVPPLASPLSSSATPYYLLPSFVLQPLGQGEEEKLERLRQTKVELEEVLPPEPGEPRVLRGTVRVLNISYHKAVHVRASRNRRAAKEGELRRLKSCMRPIKIRSGENELQVEDGAQPVSTEEMGPRMAHNKIKTEGNTEPDVASKLSNLPTVQPLPFMMQIPELTVTTDSPEKKDPSKDHPLDFIDSSQTLAFKDHPSSHEELKVPWGLMLGTETHSMEQLEVPEFSKCDLTTEGSFMEDCMEDQLRRYQELPYRLEDDAIDRELEQLYLSHLSRLRAEELGGRGEWAEEDMSKSSSPTLSLIALRQSVLTDRDLIVNWTGPERALNSSLAEEITLHYAKQRGDDSKDSEEEGFTPGYASLAPPELMGPGRESPPVLLEGCFLNHLEEGSVQQNPAEGSDSLVSLKVVSPSTLRPATQEAMVMPLVVPARTFVPLPKRPTNIPSSPLVGADAQSKHQGFLIGQGSLWLGEGLHTHKPSQTSPSSHRELEKILTRSLRFLGLFVFLPVMFSSCMPLVAVTLYLLLDWFS